MAGVDKSIEKLDVDNYATWSVKMKALLVSKGLWALVTEDKPKDEGADQKALAFIILCVRNHNLPTVAECETAREAWDTLAKIYKAKSNAMKLQLKRELNALKKLAAEPLTMYAGRAKNLRDQLKAAGSDIKDEDVALSLLAGLPSEYETIVTILEASDGKLDLDEMLSKLLPVEQRVKPEETNAYFSNGQGARDDRHFTRNEARECYYCHKKGHLKKDCRKKLRDEAASSQRTIDLFTVRPPKVEQKKRFMNNVAFSMRVPPSKTELNDWEEKSDTNKLRKRLEARQSEKRALTNEVSVEEKLVHKLQKQLEELKAQRNKLARDKVDLETKLGDHTATLSDSNGRCWSEIEPCWKTSNFIQSCGRRPSSQLDTSTTGHRGSREPRFRGSCSSRGSWTSPTDKDVLEEMRRDETENKSNLFKEELKSAKVAPAKEKERDARFILGIKKNPKRERDARLIRGIKKNLERSTEELKNVENERRAVEIAAAEIRGRAKAEKESLLADKRAADARADQYMKLAAHWEANLNNYKDEDTRREMDEAQEWKRRYVALEALPEKMLSNCIRPDIAQAVGVMSKFMTTATTVHWQAAEGVLSYVAETTDTGSRSVRATSA
jgi:hypothetical protein